MVWLDTRVSGMLTVPVMAGHDLRRAQHKQCEAKTLPRLKHVAL